VTHPKTSTPQHTAIFGEWLRQHARHSDALIAISRSAAEQLAGWLAKQRNHGNQPVIDHFLLGSELDLIRAGDPIRQSIQQIFTLDRHVFLMVGTIEPRKNHSFVLDAFDTFWAQGHSGTLLIAGHHTWKADAFLERVARHLQLDRQLFLLRDTTDAELDHAYRNASALVIASQVEGFGLPVVEAFQRGLPVLCSDIPVFREIADGRANFFDLKDGANLTRELARVCAAPPDRAGRQPQSWLTWRESTEQLCAAIMRALGRPGRTDYDRSRTPGRLECQLP
jgi:alpha-1,2-rhamnosyltransferase